jgi:hypothetical protein
VYTVGDTSELGYPYALIDIPQLEEHCVQVMHRNAGVDVLIWILFLGDSTVWNYALLPTFPILLLSPSSR